MRRKDREITDMEEILSILNRCEVLHLGLCGEGAPYVVPLNFGYVRAEDGLRLYLHGAKEGRKLDLIAQNNRASFVADCGHRLVTGKAPCNYSYAYESVMGEGVISLLTDPAKKAAGLGHIMRRFGVDNAAFPEEMLAATAVLELRVSALSGKRRTPPEA